MVSAFFSPSVQFLFCQQLVRMHSNLGQFGYESMVIDHKSKQALQSFDILGRGTCVNGFELREDG